MPTATLVEAPAVPYRVLPVITAAMLEPYAQEWRSAVKDFHRRSWRRRELLAVPGLMMPTVDQVDTALRRFVGPPHTALWLAVTSTYRLIGFLAASVTDDVWGSRMGTIQATYLWPRRPVPGLVRALADTAATWAQAQGATVLLFTTRRDRPRAWARLDFTLTGHRVWVREL